MVSDYIKKIAFEFGLTDDYIKKKVKQVLQIAKEKDLDFSNNIIIGYDMNHPLTPTWDTMLYPHVTVQRGILSIHGTKSFPTIISGWDLSSLRYFRDKRLGIKHMGLIGELGAVYESNNVIHEVLPAEEEKHYEMMQKIFVNAADMNLKIAKQGNFSKRVSCIYFEADSESHGNLKNHFFVKGKKATLSDIYAAIRLRDNFELTSNNIIFNPTIENIKEIDYLLTYVYTLQSVRLSKLDNNICISLDELDKKDFTISDMCAFVKDVLPAGWEFDRNNDFSADIKYSGDGVNVSKELTANIFAKKKFEKENYIITNIGDKKSDVLVGKNTIFFPAYGTEAQTYCEENNIAHVPVINGADYSLILAAIVNEIQKETVTQMPEVVKIKETDIGH